ncbi:MAG TPA: phage holin family protein [Patescibacteria group bacterium]
MKILLNLLLSGIAVFITAYVLPGVEVDSFVTALIVAVVLGVLNAFLKPVLLLLTLPINLLTLGLFTFVINVGLVFLATTLVSGFAVSGILWALAFSLVLSLVNSFFGMLK